jgi:hypothetical protein
MKFIGVWFLLLAVWLLVGSHTVNKEERQGAPEDVAISKARGIVFGGVLITTLILIGLWFLFY